MPVTVRNTTPADAPLIVEFNRLLAEESEGKQLDLALLRPGVARALADPAKCRYFVAEENAQALGQMMITYEWSDWRNGWIWWIQSVYVRAEARRRGVFKTLFEHVRAAAQQDGDVAAIRLYVEKGNEVAQRTYQRLGLEATGYIVLERCPV
ncbi:MAG: GNAT family N-acetyltransferase [Planctomycetia bacterium]|nr:GNAT family N-acetyltransferase [Planctomycetia bacterium]